MSSKYVRRFVTALKSGDDSTALSLLNRRLVTIKSISYAGTKHTMIECAITYGREKVVRALVSLGVDLDQYESGNTTAVGHAIGCNGVSMLSLCHRLGANMVSVRKITIKPSRPPVHYSAIEAAILHVHPACLEYLLDEVAPIRPISLTKEAISLLHITTTNAEQAVKLFKVLQTREYNFKDLEKTDDESAISDADVLLAIGWRHADQRLLRYLLKDVGLVSNRRKISLADAHEKEADTYRILQFANCEAMAPIATISKYECSGCEAVCVTKWCTGCLVNRYCSPGCQKRHWKSGGHKTECKTLFESSLFF